MDYRSLGATGLTVSRVCLGTMTFGLQCDEPTARAILDVALDHGVNFLDTADIYPIGGDLSTVGATERLLGRWLRGRRDRLVLATKFGGATGPRPGDRGASRHHIVRALEGSLTRLGTDYVDLYQLHRPDPDTPLEETLEALDLLVRSGKVRHVGCSNVDAAQLTAALDLSRDRGLTPFASVQPRYSLLSREIENTLLPLCEREGIGVVVYNPLAGGLLTGKHRREAVTPGSRFALGAAGDRYQARYWHDEMFDTVERLAEPAARAGLSQASLALRWVLSQEQVTSAIVGASRVDHLVGTLTDTSPLPRELVSSLDQMTRNHRGWADC